MDATVFLISAQYVSARRFDALAQALIAATDTPARAVRIEGTGDGMWAALDGLAAQGARRIELRPIGLPFSQSLERWLPRAAGRWHSDHPDVALLWAEPLDADITVITAAARAQVPLTPIAPDPAGHIGKGWDQPPAVRHHLLVCAGPRCHLQDAPGLAEALKQEIGRAGLAEDCLVTTTGCLFPCNQGPALVHYPAGHWYRIPDTEALRRFVAEALVSGQIPRDLHFHTTGDIHETA